MKFLTQAVEEQFKKNVPIYAGIGFEILEYIYYEHVYFLLISQMHHFSPFYTSFIAYNFKAGGCDQQAINECMGLFLHFNVRESIWYW